MDRINEGFFRVDGECALSAVVAASAHPAFARLGLANRDFYRACRPDRDTLRMYAAAIKAYARVQRTASLPAGALFDAMARREPSAVWSVGEAPLPAHLQAPPPSARSNDELSKMTRSARRAEKLKWRGKGRGKGARGKVRRAEASEAPSQEAALRTRRAVKARRAGKMPLSERPRAGPARRKSKRHMETRRADQHGEEEAGRPLPQVEDETFG